jgi:asparagine synthase (glutamine-hydrolysing)
MCGIAGIFGVKNETLVAGMLKTLRHRGPDDEFLVGQEDFTLGARRLSIIDLAGGRQPICNETEEIWVAQNGEIYNFPKLKEDLQRAGHRFRSRSDTEVLVHLYEEKGDAFVNNLNGMYAFAIWDGKKKRGILARDRVGKKPLYYHLSSTGVLYFASEIKALLTLPFFDRRIHLPALHHFLSYKHVPAPLSIFEGIKILPPAHYLVYSRDEEGCGRVSLKRYWRLDFGRTWTSGLEEDEIVEHLLKSLKASVERRLISDVPIGFFLSGGIDSSLCTALAATVSSQPVETFTLTYGPQSTTPAKERDREFGAVVSARYRTRHHEEVIESAHLEEELSAILSHFDEPFAGVLSAYFLARRISRHVKVAVSGDGADELFGSYLSHRIAAPIQAYLEDGSRWVDNGNWDHLSPEDKTFVERIAVKEDWRWRCNLLVFSDAEKRSLYRGELADQLASTSTAGHLKAYFSDLTARDPLNRVLEAEFNSQLPDQVLTYVDRLSMAHSLEVRAPYLDTEFMELAAGIDGAWKIRQGQTKYILKKAALCYLPEDLVYRPKEGFILPINQWLLESMEPYVRSLLSHQRLGRHGLFKPDYVQELVENFYRGGAQLANKLWALIVFQIWYESYMENPIAA